MSISEYVNIVKRGLVAQMAPSVLQGALVELLRPITIEQAVQWVNNNTSLWDTLGQERQKGLIIMARNAGSLDWLTAAWVIGAVKADCPALASLFMGWTKSHNWLVRQVKIIHSEVEV